MRFVESGVVKVQVFVGHVAASSPASNSIDVWVRREFIEATVVCVMMYVVLQIRVERLSRVKLEQNWWWNTRASLGEGIELVMQ